LGSGGGKVRGFTFAQGNGPEHIGNGGIKRKGTSAEIDTHLPPEKRILSVEICPLAKIKHPQHTTAQEREGSKAVNHVGDD